MGGFESIDINFWASLTSTHHSQRPPLTFKVLATFSDGIIHMLKRAQKKVFEEVQRYGACRKDNDNHSNATSSLSLQNASGGCIMIHMRGMSKGR